MPPPMRPTTRESTVTVASLTRCMSVIKRGYSARWQLRAQVLNIAACFSGVRG
jgi:hypothetical protein